MSRRTVLIGAFVYTFLCGLVFFLFVNPELAFSGDADSYNRGSLHLLSSGFYSLDGVRPYLEREPLYSLFLAAVYFFAGIENAPAVFMMQAFLVFVCSVVFVSAIARRWGSRIAIICFFLLLTSPSVFHSVFIIYREALTLCLCLLLATCILSLLERPRWSVSLALGVCMGLLPLLYFPFVLMPIGLLGYLLFERINIRMVGVTALLFLLIPSVWGIRNAMMDGRFRIIDSGRSDIMWYTRGEQAAHLRGIMEPLRCLEAEYLTRDWSNRSPYCSTAGLFHQRWPQGLDVPDLTAGAEGRANIRANVGWYLWYSPFEVIELHLPFVGAGWPFLFNVLAVLGSALLYVAFLLGLPHVFSRQYLLFWLMIGYQTVALSLTEAHPRYFTPLMFCYAVIAAVGINGVSRHFSRQQS